MAAGHSSIVHEHRAAAAPPDHVLARSKLLPKAGSRSGQPDDGYSRRRIRTDVVSYPRLPTRRRIRPDIRASLVEKLRGADSDALSDANDPCIPGFLTLDGGAVQRVEV